MHIPNFSKLSRWDTKFVQLLRSQLSDVGQKVVKKIHIYIENVEGLINKSKSVRWDMG